MFGPEYARACGIEALEPLGVYLPGDKNYPGGERFNSGQGEHQDFGHCLTLCRHAAGGVFDPLNLSKDPGSFEDLKVKELKNGRLAMVAWLGFSAQAAWTHQGPIENLVQFTEDPTRNNILTIYH